MSYVYTYNDFVFDKIRRFGQAWLDTNPGEHEDVQLFEKIGELSWRALVDHKSPETILTEIGVDPADYLDPSPPIPPTAPLTRLHRDGRRLLNADGQQVHLKGISAFRLAELVATGRRADAIAFLDWARQYVNYVRVFLTARNMFTLDPQVGLDVLPEVFQLGAERGLYVEAVLMADRFRQTAGGWADNYPGYDWAHHFGAAGVIAESFPNSLLEGVNEPGQPWQKSTVQQITAWASGVPAIVPMSMGAADGANDESTEFYSSRTTYGTGHTDRADGPNGWRKVRHCKEQMNVSETVDRYVSSNEPYRMDQDPDPEKQLGLGLLERVCQIGGLLHAESFKHCALPTPAEQAALDARVQGWAFMPETFAGVFTNTGWSAPLPESPCRSFTPIDSDSRVYARIQGNEAYVVSLHTHQGAIVWGPGWQAQHALELPKVQLYHVTR